ncbi:MAG TPA: S41 family peptidase [Anaeromyxobacter sp.]
MLPSHMLVPIALAAALTLAASPSGLPPVPADAAAAAAEACEGASAPAEPSCAGAPLCAAPERVRAACALRDAIRARYVFLAEKPALVGGGFDPAARLDAFVATERAIAREDEPLRFYDRVRETLSSFQDGHLIVTSPDRLPQVALGVGLRRAGKRIVVAWREPALRALAGDVIADALPLGAEVVDLDGRPASDAAADLARLVPGSSPAARLERGVDALTRRDFAFPERPTTLLGLRTAAGERREVELRWWRSPGAERHPVARGWAGRVRLPSTDRLAWFDDAIRPVPAAFAGRALAEGAPPWAPAVPAIAVAGLREWTDENGRVAVRAGDVDKGVAHPFCYLQILSFHTERLVSAPPSPREAGLAGSGPSRPFAEPIEEFVRGCGAKGRDVVLDLRRNEGGYLDHSTAVAEALLPKGAAERPAALLLRATERNEAVYRERSDARGAATDGPLAPRHVLDAIGAARRSGRPLTPAFVSAPRGGAGFAGRVVALVSPACMSACDRLAALLSGSGRAVLVGAPTEGAGGSQQEAPGLPARWTDPTRRLSVAIPNAAFGVPRRASGPVVNAADDAPARESATGEVPAEDFFRSFGIENRPIEPDVRFEPRAEDVSGTGRGWIEQVEAILNGTPLA